MHAKLRDVPALRAHARTQHQRHQSRDCRDRTTTCETCGGKRSAAGVANDVVQKAHGAMRGAVLIVDQAVGMIAIGLGDQPRRGVRSRRARGAVRAPGADRRAARSERAEQVLHHEQPADRASNPASRKAAACAPEGCSSNCDSMRSTCGEFCSDSNRCRSSVSSISCAGCAARPCAWVQPGTAKTSPITALVSS